MARHKGIMGSLFGSSSSGKKKKGGLKLKKYPKPPKSLKQSATPAQIARKEEAVKAYHARVKEIKKENDALIKAHKERPQAVKKVNDLIRQTRAHATRAHH